MALPRAEVKQAEMRATVQEILARISPIAAGLRLEALQPQIGACRNQLQGGGGVDVAVFGRFKAGKSSLLNCLAGAEALPVGVVPVTAVITRLRYGPAARATVSFQDGSHRQIPAGDLARYVAEQDNPGNRKRVSAVEVELPGLKAFAPARFVDTPGLGSALEHNTEAALNWLPNVGAALVAVSCDAPLSDGDLALLAELRRHTPSIAVLLTKADLLTEPQRAEVLAYVQEQWRRKWREELRVFFCSVRPGFEGLNEPLRREVLLPLVRDQARTAEEILRHKLRSLAERTLGYLRVGLATAARADSARQALRERLAGEREQFDLLREELSALALEWSATALETALARLRPALQALQRRAAEELNERLRDWRLRLPALLHEWRAWLQGFLGSQLAEISRAQRTMFCEPLRRAERHWARTLQGFQDRLRTQVQAALGISLAPHEIELQAREPSSPPVDVGYAGDVAFELVAHVIPLSLVRRPIEAALARKTRWEVEKNLSRLAAAWQERVAAAIHELANRAERAAAGELSALEEMLARGGSNEPDLRRAVAVVEGALADL